MPAILLRLLLAFITAVAAFYFVLWMGGALLSTVGLFALAPFAGLLCAIGAGRFVWTRSASLGESTSIHAGAAAHAGLGALVVGGIGFVGGFFGPMILAPDANQGPLLGLFITGPLGAIAGAIGGLVLWSVRRKAV